MRHWRSAVLLLPHRTDLVGIPAGPNADQVKLEANLSVLPDALVFGQSEVMRAVRQKVEKVAGANVPVLIQGESGTGKEVIARLIHARSPWGSGPFVKVNCPAIPGTLVESELFGYQKGAFTGANGTKPGRVEMAQHGTLFLDEIAELEMGLQAKLLQLLQDGQFCAVGGQEDKHIDARVVCATNRNLDEEIRKANFRQNLFYRINAVTSSMLSLKKVTREAKRELEGKIIVKALQAHNWNRRRAASALEISYRALLYKLKEAGLPTRKSRQNPQAAGLSEE